MFITTTEKHNFIGLRIIILTVILTSMLNQAWAAISINSLAEQTDIQQVESEQAREKLMTTSAPRISASAWEMYLAVYLGWTQEIGEPAQPAKQLAFLASNILTMKTEGCQSDYLAEVKVRFKKLLLQYPKELAALEPQQSKQWCSIGKVLQRYGEQQMTLSNSSYEH